MSPPLIETRQLSKHFGGVQAVREIDFSLAEGELRCLIGPNGAGKSTFFKLLTGQIKPSSGSVLFRGKDITGLQAHEIAGPASASRRRCRAYSTGFRCARTSGSRRPDTRKARRSRRRWTRKLSGSRSAALSTSWSASGRTASASGSNLAGAVRGPRPHPARRAGSRDDRGGARPDGRTHPRDRPRPSDDRGRARHVVYPHHRPADYGVRSGSILMEGDVAQVFGNQAVRDVYLGKQVAA